jgi:DNA polymerase-3 subunit gamma/tau
MDQFIVSARKYRPQTFDTVVGQSHITTTLKNAISQNHLAHAFLFCGPRGVGKTTCARILAKTINCEHRLPNGEACDKCSNCKSFNDGISLNIHELDAASNNSVEDIRELTDQVRIPPQSGKYKVYIIDEVHMLSASAFNAFLKTLEEPPSYALFILATTEKHKILPTILSRCQIFDFKRITTADTVGHLQEIAVKEGIEAEKAALEIIARKSEGCMRDSLSILDKIVSFSGGKVTYQETIEHLNILDADYFFRFMEKMKHQELNEVLLLFDNVNYKGFEGDVLLNSFSEFLRNLLVSKDEKAAALLEAVDSFKERYKMMTKEVSASWIISALSLLNEAEIQYKQARNKRLHVEMTLIKLTYLSQALDSAGGKKKLSEEIKPVRFRQIKPFTPAAKQTPVNKEVKSKQNTPLVQANLPKITEQKPKASQVITPTSTQSSSKNIIPPAPGKLASIRGKVAESEGKQKEIIKLEINSLSDAWSKFIDKLRNNNKLSAATNFEMMMPKIVAEDLIEIECPGDIQMGFLRQEKSQLVDYLQTFFSNPRLTIEPTISTQIDDNTPPPALFSTKEQYLKLIEKYPLVKSMKDRLNLELDY